MKRHLLVTNDFPPKVGGIQNYLWDLWQRLDPSSYVVLTASSHPDATAFDAAQSERGVRIERVAGSTLFVPTPAALHTVREHAERHQVDLVVLDPDHHWFVVLKVLYQQEGTAPPATVAAAAARRGGS